MSATIVQTDLTTLPALGEDETTRDITGINKRLLSGLWSIGDSSPVKFKEFDVAVTDREVGSYIMSQYANHGYVVEITFVSQDPYSRKVSGKVKMPLYRTGWGRTLKVLEEPSWWRKGNAPFIADLTVGARPTSSRSGEETRFLIKDHLVLEKRIYSDAEHEAWERSLRETRPGAEIWVQSCTSDSCPNCWMDGMAIVDAPEHWARAVDAVVSNFTMVLASKMMWKHLGI